MELPEVEAGHTLLSHKQQQQTKEKHKEGNDKLNFVHKFLDYFEENVSKFGQNHKKILFILLRVVLLIGCIAFVVVACVKNFERARVLFNISIIIIAYMLYCAFKRIFGSKINITIIVPITKNARCMCAMRWILIIGFSVFVAVWVIRDSLKEPYRLVSISGLFVFVAIGFVTSRHRKQIKWKPVVGGFALQFLFGILVLRTPYGYSAFKWLGDRFSILMATSRVGSRFVFGDLKAIAFTALPFISCFASLVCLMWYFGMIQFLVKKIGWLLGMTLGTTPPESMSAAANIFLGISTTPLLILPYLKGMTESELHALMTSAFASISGAGLAVYVSVGASATHLISASLISAPAGLAMAKLMCPETEDSPSKNISDIKMEKAKYQNPFEAISDGARISIGAIASIVVNIIAFLGVLELLNGVLRWLGAMVDVPQLSFEFICSYLFMPFALVMGVPWSDLGAAGEILGINSFVGTFIAFQRIAVLKENRLNQTLTNGGGGGEKLPVMSHRAEVISTYALCGYSTVTSIGIVLGILGSFIPERFGVLAKLVVRSLCAGTLACFCTACMAGLLYVEE